METALICNKLSTCGVGEYGIGIQPYKMAHYLKYLLRN